MNSTADEFTNADPLDTAVRLGLAVEAGQFALSPQDEESAADISNEMQWRKTRQRKSHVEYSGGYEDWPLS